MDAIFAVTPFNGKCQDLQTSNFRFLIFAKMWPMWTILADTYTDGNTETEIDKPRRNLADLPKNILDGNIQ